MTSSPAGSDIVACLLLRLAGRGPRVAGRGRLGRGAAHGLLRHRRLTMPELPLLLQLGYPPSASARNASARADEHQGRQRSFGAVWSSAVGGESRRGRRGDGHAERLAPDEHAPGADLEVDVRRDVVVLVPLVAAQVVESSGTVAALTGGAGNDGEAGASCFAGEGGLVSTTWDSPAGRGNVTTEAPGRRWWEGRTAGAAAPGPVPGRRRLTRRAGCR